MAWKLFSRKPKHAAEKWNYRTMFGPNMNFAASEAYKLLRTNVMFSFSDEGECHVVGLTSPVQDEGKSSTACNLAYALAEAGERVLLLEADLRRPSVASKLGISRVPGLTNLLVSKGDFNEMIQNSTAAPKLDILTSGDITPNPSELLGSNRMAKLMEELKAHYDYIVVDLPPVTVVSDAIAISKLLDGIVVVVRGGASDQNMLAEAMRQLKMVNVRILGFVYRDNSVVHRSKYKKYYSEYGKKRERK